MSIFLLSNLANHSEFGNGILEEVMTYFFFLIVFQLLVSCLKLFVSHPKLVNQGLNNFYTCKFPFRLNVCILLFQ